MSDMKPCPCRAEKIGISDGSSIHSYQCSACGHRWPRQVTVRGIAGLRYKDARAAEPAPDASSNGRTPPFEGVNAGSTPAASTNEPAPSGEQAVGDEGLLEYVMQIRKTANPESIKTFLAGNDGMPYLSVSPSEFRVLYQQLAAARAELADVREDLGRTTSVMQDFQEKLVDKDAEIEKLKALCGQWINVAERSEERERNSDALLATMARALREAKPDFETWANHRRYQAMEEALAAFDQHTKGVK